MTAYYTANDVFTTNDASFYKGNDTYSVLYVTSCKVLVPLFIDCYCRQVLENLTYAYG